VAARVSVGVRVHPQEGGDPDLKARLLEDLPPKGGLHGLPEFHPTSRERRLSTKGIVPADDDEEFVVFDKYGVHADHGLD